MFRQLRLDGVLLVLVLLLISPIAGANSALTGSWYNPDRDGEGFHIEILPDQQALVIWFTYPGPNDDPEAEQAWILGTGSVTDNTINIVDAFRTHGPVFGPGYEQDDLVIETWGNLTLTFSDNNNGVVDFSGTDGEGTTDIIRITSLANQEDSGRFPVGMSGAWYNPDTNGQGWFMEVLSDELALLYFFTYDKNGNQAWSLEAGYFDGNRVVVANTKSGKGTRFGDQFDQEKVQREAFVNIVMEYDGCDGGWARFETVDGAVSDNVPIVRSTSLSSAECKNLVLIPGDGGSIQSTSGDNDCLESQTCLVDIQGAGSFSDSFTVVPRTGWIFAGWEEAADSACAGKIETCVPVTESIDGDAAIKPIFQPEGTPYYPPKDSLMVCSYTEPKNSQSLQCEMKLFEDYGYGKLSDFTVTSDRLFIDYETRKKELQVLSEPERQDFCDISQINEVIDFSTYIPLPPPNPDQDVNPPWPGVVEPLVLGRVQFTLLENEAAGQMIRRILLEWAQNEVDLNWDLTTYHDLNGEAHYQLGLTMIIYVLAWDAIRLEDFVSPQDRKIIDDYLHGLMTFLTQMLAREEGHVFENEFDCPYPCEFGVEVFNHAWTQDLSLMAYGVLTGNDTLYQRGIRRFFAALDGIVRPDGSHYSDSQRGGSALSYSIGSTDTLIRIAELAASQGHDLYGVEIDGKSLNTIMGYHVSVLEDETLMHPYSQSALELAFYCEDQACTDNWNNLFWSEENYHGFYRDSGWIEFDVYRKRFPGSPLVERYLSEIPGLEVYASSEGPFIHSCEFRDFSN